MNWDAIGAIGEIVGAIAVVTTLFYLARQTHQSVELEHGKEQRVIIDQFNAYVRIMTEPNNLPAIRKGFKSYTTLDPDQQVIAWRNFAQWVNYYEQMNYSYLSGLIPNAILDAVGAWVVSMLITPGGSEYWRDHGSSHGIDVYKKLGGLLSDTENLPEPVTDTYSWLDCHE
jgi:hypothetical protein